MSNGFVIRAPRVNVNVIIGGWIGKSLVLRIVVDRQNRVVGQLAKHAVPVRIHIFARAQVPAEDFSTNVENISKKDREIETLRGGKFSENFGANFDTNFGKKFWYNFWHMFFGTYLSQPPDKK